MVGNSQVVYVVFSVQSLKHLAAMVGPKWFTRRRTVSYETVMTRSASKSSTSRKLREPKTEPYRLPNDLGRKSISVGADFLHYLGCRAAELPSCQSGHKPETT
jgi:hypothetical protein